MPRRAASDSDPLPLMRADARFVARDFECIVRETTALSHLEYVVTHPTTGRRACLGNKAPVDDEHRFVIVTLPATASSTSSIHSIPQPSPGLEGLLRVGGKFRL